MLDRNSTFQWVPMSDLCLVASMVAKMHMAAQNSSAPIPPSGLQTAHPRSLRPVVAQVPAPTVTRDQPTLEFSPDCAATVNRVYQMDGRTLPIAFRPATSRPATPQPSSDRPEFTPIRNAQPETATPPRFNTSYQGPRTGSELYHQRIAALQQGRLYTRLPSNSFREIWSKAKAQPTYEQWKNLLAMEARAVGGGQGNNQLSVMIGDSISLWLPTEALPSGQLWLNQGISGDTTDGVLSRLSHLKQTRADHIYVMAGINDLRRGATDNEVLWNLRLIMRQLHRDHPQAQVFVQSILPTAIGIPNDRIRRLNQKLATIAHQEGVDYLDLYPHFADAQGELRPELTTDGLHLSAVGYGVWQSVLREVNYLFVEAPRSSFAA